MSRSITATWVSRVGERVSWDGAIASFRRVTELNPEHAEAHNLLGQVLWGQGRWSRRSPPSAARSASAHPGRNPEQPRRLLHAQGQLDEAIAVFRAAIQLSPDLAEAHNNLGNAFWAQGRFEEAIAACGRASR